jgi:hypothetical protein
VCSSSGPDPAAPSATTSTSAPVAGSDADPALVVDDAVETALQAKARAGLLPG